MLFWQVPVLELQNRRQRLFEMLDHQTVVCVFSSSLNEYKRKTRFEPFRQNPDFWYLSGLETLDSVLVFFNFEVYLFYDPPSDIEQRWLGIGENFDDLKTKSAIKNLSLKSELENYLNLLIKKNLLKKIELSGISKQDFAEEFLPTQDQDKIKVEQFSSTSALLRMFKSNWEISQIRISCNIAKQAHQTIEKNIPYYPPSSQDGINLYEYQIESDLIKFYHNMGHSISYWPIVASGERGNILNYARNCHIINPKDLLLIDSGCQVNGYCSDITRTFHPAQNPSEIQKKLISQVKKIQQEVIKRCKNHKSSPVTLSDLHSLTCIEIINFLSELEILKGSLEKNLKTKSFQKYFPHKTSHHLGLEVHDPSLEIYSDSQQPIYLKPGMVFTIEPGLYFPASDQETPPDLRGLAVRIEDDILITENGVEIL